jgi:hypothetical protein
MVNIKKFSSRKEVTEFLATKGIDTSNWSEVKWLSFNKGQAEIHMMALAEAMWDAYNESTPKQLEEGEWHIPFEVKINNQEFTNFKMKRWENKQVPTGDSHYDILVKISTAMAAHTSYTLVGEEKEKPMEKWIEIHDKLVAYNPPHSSPMEHCARVMSEEEYNMYWKSYGTKYKDKNEIKKVESGWCRNFKGFIQYRHLIENGQIF